MGESEVPEGHIGAYVSWIAVRRKGTGPVSPQETLAFEPFGKAFRSPLSSRTLMGIGVVFSPAGVCALLGRSFPSVSQWLLAGPLPFGYATWLAERLRDRAEALGDVSSLFEGALTHLRTEAAQTLFSLLRQHGLLAASGGKGISAVPFRGDVCGRPDVGEPPRGGGLAPFGAPELLLPHLAGRRVTWEEFSAYGLAFPPASQGESRSALRRALARPGPLLERWRAERRVFLVPSVEPTPTGTSFLCNRCGTRFLPDSDRFPTPFGWEEPVCPACRALGDSRPGKVLVEGAWSLLSPRVSPSLSPSDAASLSTRPPSEARAVSLPSSPLPMRSRGEEPSLFRPVLPRVSFSEDALTPAQRRIAEALRERVSGPRSEARGTAPEFLLWAVTGAGKTEVLFPLLGDVLRAGGRVLWTTPRRDVVDELAPRFANAFPGVPLAAYRGGRSGPLALPPLVLATAHQTLRMSAAFSLVVVDEADAFPLNAEPFLWRSVWRVAGDSPLVYLTATPPASLLRRLLLRDAVFLLPRRFHGRPLPVPRTVRVPHLAAALAHGRLPEELTSWLKGRLLRGRRVYLFVPYVDASEALADLLRRAGFAAAGVSARASERDAHIAAFREGRISVLATTTILERGITVPFADVGVVGACAEHFDAATLVQMAGRAGRKAEDEEAEVVFFVERSSPEVERAVRTVRELNALAAGEDVSPRPEGEFPPEKGAPISGFGAKGDSGHSGGLSAAHASLFALFAEGGPNCTGQDLPVSPSEPSSTPPRCLSCGRPLPRTRNFRLPQPMRELEAVFCRTCLERFEVPSGRRCAHCGVPLKDGRGEYCADCARFWLRPEEPLRYQRSALLYVGIVRELVHAWKGGRNPALLRPFVAFLLRTYRDEGLAREGVQALVPVPSSPEGEIVRGFSPALHLALGLGEYLGVPVRDVLSLEDPGGRQSARSRAERRRAERALLYTGPPELVRGLRLLLVDDVYTTGETLHRAARVLAEAGAEAIFGLTLSRAIPRREGECVVPRTRFSR
ncbi:MAG: ComF operon protein A, DNA transporter ATPase [Brockia lithotrophica]|uniref:ComF operon protein A, DNA transporter ATPase n=1 Tax=Brockia lithotrophica TaxID=933949 RepID=A0A2T5G472_9BACL|nr:MAG: ComF operon protein A, DNA transporter ATPase [Brockia lithotrophica]